MQIKDHGVCTGVYIGNVPGSLESVAVPQLNLTFEGATGDRHFGFTQLSDARTPWYPKKTVIRNIRQVSIISAEEMQAVANGMEIPEIKPEWIGANICVSGVADFTGLPPSSRIFFANGSVLKIEEENAPCSHAGRMIMQKLTMEKKLDASLQPDKKTAGLFALYAKHRRGVVCTVEKEGCVVPGETFHVRVYLKSG